MCSDILRNSTSLLFHLPLLSFKFLKGFLPLKMGPVSLVEIFMNRCLKKKKELQSDSFPSQERAVIANCHFLLCFPSHPLLENEKKFIIGAWAIPSVLRSLGCVSLKGSKSYSISQFPDLGPSLETPQWVLPPRESLQVNDLFFPGLIKSHEG